MLLCRHQSCGIDKQEAKLQFIVRTAEPEYIVVGTCHIQLFPMKKWQLDFFFFFWSMTTWFQTCYIYCEHVLLINQWRNVMDYTLFSSFCTIKLYIYIYIFFFFNTRRERGIWILNVSNENIRRYHLPQRSMV